MTLENDEICRKFRKIGSRYLEVILIGLLLEMKLQTKPQDLKLVFLLKSYRSFPQNWS